MTILLDHPDMSLTQKQMILADWARFMAAGFSFWAMSDALFDFLFVGFWTRHLPDQYETFLHGDVERKSKVAFWNHYFDRDLSTLKDILQAIVQISKNPDRQFNG